jgi:DNA-binding PadR family transcriptional regulator
MDTFHGVLEKEGQMRSRSESLEFALLGLLSQAPLHGYELRKRIGTIFGPFRALSFSVLYPQLRRMMEAGLIAETVMEATSRRSRIVYAITDKGARRFESLTESVTPETWEDEGFEIRFAFFSPTSANNRVRILEGKPKSFVVNSRSHLLVSTNIWRSGDVTHWRQLIERLLGWKT